MTIAEALRAFLANCPLLENGRLNVDFLAADAAAYSVDVVPITPIVKQYLDGSAVRQYPFVLSSRFAYGEDVRQQLDNCGFFERFSAWITAQNRAKSYPALGVGRRVLRLEVTTSGYVFDPDADTARYQIQCNLRYFERSIS